MKKYIIWGAALLSAFTASATNDLVTDLGNGSLNIDLSQPQLGTNIENGITGFTLPATDATAKTSLDSKLTMLKLNLTLPDDVTGTVSEVTVSGLHNKATYLTGSNAYGAFIDANLGYISATNGSKGFTIGADHKVTVYVAIFPEDVAANQVTVTATVDYKDYAFTLAGAKSLKEGKLIPVTTSLTKGTFRWKTGITKADNVRAAVDDNNLVIASDNDLTIADFAILRDALQNSGYADGTICLTFLNQTSLPVDGETGALESCTSLKSVSAPNVTVINNFALYKCTNLTSVSLPKATSVGVRAFFECQYLPSVFLPEVTSVEEGAFCGCYNLNSVSLPEATSLGKYIFERCFYIDTIATLSLPKATSVDAKAFVSCNRSNIALTTSDASNWYKELGGDETDNYGWKSLNIIKTKNFQSAYTADDYKTWSEENCGSSVSYDDMCMYLGAGVYWDDGAEGDNQQTYTLPDGNTYHAGLWVMKKEYIEGFSAGTASKLSYASTMKGRPTDINKYFFLPAAGEYYNGSFRNLGSNGNYWLSSPYYYYAYQLRISIDYAKVAFSLRDYGYLPMIAE